MSETRARSTTFSIPPEISEEFMAKCKDKGYNASALVRNFIKSQLEAWTEE